MKLKFWAAWLIF